MSDEQSDQFDKLPASGVSPNSGECGGGAGECGGGEGSPNSGESGYWAGTVEGSPNSGESGYGAGESGYEAGESGYEAGECGGGEAGRWAHLTDRCSEWFSSILVKETRQALKSRQFLWTFFVLLVLAGVWTMVGLTFSGDDIESGDAGPPLFFGFCLILGFPLGVIIPFGAFRSLAQEFEDGTIQLISITTMRPYQIIAGKLGSSALQMLVYLSVLAPCIALTYLLRGISLQQIAMAMLICILGSLCLSVVGLFLASLARIRMFGVGISVLFVILLIWLYTMWFAFMLRIAYYTPLNLMDDQSKVVFFAFISLFASSAALLFAAAAAQISFPADNRSTLIRVMMLVQQTLFFACCLNILSPIFLHEEMFLVIGFMYGHYWLVMGSLMAGESPILSRRVRRSLPESTVHRTLFSLLMPGPGRGFLFGLANLWACTLMLIMIGQFHSWLLWYEPVARSIAFAGRGVPANLGGAYLAVLANAFYVSFYLSAVFLIVRWLHKRTKRAGGPVSGIAIAFLLVAGTTLAATLIQFNFVPRWAINGWSEWQIINWYWTSVALVDQRLGTVNPLCIFVFALSVILATILAVAVAAKEFSQGRVATPERVLADQQPKRQAPPLPAGETIDEIFAKPRGSEG